MQFGWDLSRMLAGIGIFLLGVSFLEETLRKLAGRPFKLFLRRQTTNKLKAITGGAIVTAVLQSSSVVNLMVLAFVGAGVITMQNALAVILGANIGTTVASWVVASVGFEFNIDHFALPMVGLAGIGMALFAKEGRRYQWAKFMFGIGSLFVGLEFMKSSFEQLASHFDFSLIQHYPLIVFVLFGLLLTSVIQASSATVAITLSALHVNAISLLAATAIVLGSEVGTTVKLLLAAMDGIPAKKRVALGNFIYNATMIVIIFLFLRPMNYFITHIVSIHDNLYALVFFQSIINVLGVIVFYPFLNLFGRFLENRFRRTEEGSQFIKLVPSAEGDTALEALDRETRGYIYQTIDYNMDSFDLPHDVRRPEYNTSFHSKSLPEKYDNLKHLHGEVHAYCIRINRESLNETEDERLEQVISSLRNCMFAAKSVKDCHADIDQFRNSSNDTKYRFYHHARETVEKFYHPLIELMDKKERGNLFNDLVSIYHGMQRGYDDELAKLYKEGISAHLSEIEISTLINFNRELFSSFKAMVWAIKDYLLDKTETAYFDDLPGFIR